MKKIAFLKQFVWILCIVITLGFEARSQPAFPFPGDYNYLLNKPPNDAVIFTPDNSKAVTMSSVSSPQNGGQVTSFDPITGTQFDTKFAGFGPADVELIQLSDGIRVVALTTRGGPRTVTIFDMNAAGQLAFRAETQLTTSGNDESSNLILSARGRAGFVRVFNSSGVLEIVSFSLDSGSILQHVNLFASDFLSLYEDANRCVIATGFGLDLNFIDASDPLHMVSLGQTTLPGTGVTGGDAQMYTVFSRDGSQVFAGSDRVKLSAVNTVSRLVTGTLSTGNYSSAKLKVAEFQNSRLIGLRGTDSGVSFLGIVIVDASNPANMQVVNRIDLGQDFFTRRDFAFSKDTKKITVMSNTGISTYRLPELTLMKKAALLTSFGFNLDYVGQSDHVVGTWGSNNNFGSTVYAFSNRSNKIANFDRDGNTDLSFFRNSDASWHWTRSIDGLTLTTSFGSTGDIPVNGDFDGDDISDLAVYRPGTGHWLIRESNSGVIRDVAYGVGSDIPVPADYDGDGMTDSAIVKRFPNRWSVLKSSTGQLSNIRLGYGRLKPVIGDYDDDGKADVATFVDGNWNIIKSLGTSVQIAFGQPGDVPISGDFDNDGKTDVAVYRPGTQTWRIQESYAGLVVLQFGQIGDLPVPADYDGDGKTDIAVFRPSTSTWQIVQSTNNGTRTVQFGSSGDRPLTVQQ